MNGFACLAAWPLGLDVCGARQCESCHFDVTSNCNASAWTYGVHVKKTPVLLFESKSSDIVHFQGCVVCHVVIHSLMLHHSLALQQSDRQSRLQESSVVVDWPVSGLTCMLEKIVSCLNLCLYPEVQGQTWKALDPGA